MKKLNVLFAAVAFFFAIQSCQKAEEYQNVALTQTINQNESYTFELPVTDDPYRVIQEAQNATISLIGVNATGNPIYSYTPNADFVGTDSVILQTYHNPKGEGKHGKGNHHEDHDMDKNVQNNTTQGFCGTGNKPDFDNDKRGKCGNDTKANTEDDYTVTITIQVLPVAQNMKTTL